MQISVSVMSWVQMIQAAFKIIALLQFTAYLWPKQANLNGGEVFDYIIVGAGTAGSVIANRLTENPDVNVLLIEAGGDPPIESDLPGALLFLQHSEYDWNFSTENDAAIKQCHQKPYLELTQGKMLGGSSSLNYLQYARGYPIDYNSWAKITNEYTWEWENVLPYFIKSERCEVTDITNSSDRKYHGVDGYLGVTKENLTDVTQYFDSLKALGHEIVNDHNPDNPLGYSPLLLTISGGHRQSSAIAFLTPAKDRRNLYVLKETIVNKIVIKNLMAIGVQAVTSDDKNIMFIAKKEIIVSAGTINSAKLLMLSGIGPKQHLESFGIPVVSDVPVGENLQDHTAVVILHKLNIFKSVDHPINPHKFPAMSFGGFVALNKKQEYPDYAVGNFMIKDIEVSHFCSYVFRFKHDICDAIYKKIKGRMVMYNQIFNLAPISRGRVLLKSSNPNDDPRIYPGHLNDRQDLDNLAKYIQDFSPIVNTSYFKRINAEVVDPLNSCQDFKRGTLEYARCYAQCLSYSMHHYTSTCPMGKVLDGKLKVFGVESLRVADASVMPTIPHANPFATVVMIGEKAADFIKEEHKI